MANRKQPKNAVCESGVFVYIGPTIRGAVQNGSIFRGSETDVKNKVAALVENVENKEQIGKLIIRDRDLAAAKEKLRKGGNSLSMAYRALLSVK